MMLARTGLIAMIGKGERGPVAIEHIRRYRAASLIAEGGASFLVSKAIRSTRIVAFANLGMEAIPEFGPGYAGYGRRRGNEGSLHDQGPNEWRARVDDLSSRARS